MGTLRTVIIVILAISFLTFVAFFGRLPGFRNTPIGFLHRVLWIHIPKAFRALDEWLTGGRISRTVANLETYLFYKKNPIVLVFFLGLLTGASGLFLSYTWTTLSLAHKFWVFVLLPQPYIYTYLCARPRQASIITEDNLSFHLKQYPYDNVLYHEGRTCRTCHFVKPARSKHCSLCDACVARADHHCVWVNNCVGYGNYKYFLVLLLSCTILLAYGAYLAYLDLSPKVSDHIARFPRWHQRYYTDRQDLFSRLIMKRAEVWIDSLGTAFMIGGVAVGAVGMLALLTAPLPAGLLGYHIYLIWAGMTTNESGKWADFKEDMYDGLVWVKDVDQRESAMASGNSYVQDEYQWPTRSRLFSVITFNAQQPDDNVHWRRAWKLADVENIYDLGFIESLKHVLRN